MEKTTGLKITSPNVVVITSPYLLPLLLLLFLLHVFVLRTSGDHPFCENALWDRIKTGRIKNNRKKEQRANNADYDHSGGGRKRMCTKKGGKRLEKIPMYIEEK